MKTLKNPVVHIANRATAQVDKPLCAAGILSMENTEEIWKPIPGYEGLYEASNWGRIKSVRWKTLTKILKQNPRSDGYLSVAICKESQKTMPVHKLVFMTFHYDRYISRATKMVIDHIDNIRTNNNLDNLQLITNRLNSSKNCKDKIKSSKYVGVNWSTRESRWRSTISINGKREHLGNFRNEEDASRAYQNRLNEI